MELDIKIDNVIDGTPVEYRGIEYELNFENPDNVHASINNDKFTFVRDQAIAKETTNLELANGVEEKQAALKCPPAYKELDSRKDRARLKELEAASKARPLTAAEKIEQKHLQARLKIYSRTPESADCDRMNFLKDLGPKDRTPDEKAELERLEARYPEVPFDPTRARVLAAEFMRRMIVRRGLPPGSRSEKAALSLRLPGNQDKDAGRG